MNSKKTGNNMPDWLTDGFEHIWLPYTQMKTAKHPLPVKTAFGSVLKLEDGRELIDGISSWWSVCHGYSHPHIVEAMQKQVEKLSHVMFAGLAHEPAYMLAKRLSAFAPEGLNRVFFADSGSSAVEIAMKMAVQYWHNKGNKKRNKFISFKDGYHGETMGALSLGDPDGWTKKTFNNYGPHQFFVNIPKTEYDFAELDETLSAIKKEAAAIVIEPLVQGAGGMKFHSADILAEIYRLAKKHEIIFIADEIMTGFFRTGNRFACDEAGIIPDIMCVGKALSAGMISLAAVLTKDEIFDAFKDDSFDKAFLHGPTFMANPLACAAANASLDLFEKDSYLEKVENIERFLLKELAIFRNHKEVAAIRVKGAIGVIQLKEREYEQMWKHVTEMRGRFVDQGVWIRPFKDVIYLMPNYNISEDELKKLVDAIRMVLG